MFGSWTVMEITYRTVEGRLTKVGVGAKETLDKLDFQKILDSIIEINPNLHIPPELRT